MPWGWGGFSELLLCPALVQTGDRLERKFLSPYPRCCCICHCLATSGSPWIHNAFAFHSTSVNNNA